MENNICRFVPFHKDYHSIHTINFVFEANAENYNRLISESVYKMYFVCEGSGLLHTLGKIQPIKLGDVFFTFPASPYKIESKENLKYMYISFIGQRGNMLMEESGVTKFNFLFSGCDEILENWKKALEFPSSVSGLMSESVLLYTFAFLTKRNSSEATDTKQNDIVSVMKKYIDDNFTIPDFSLEKISQEFSYNKKYLSNVFKNNMKMGVIEYLNTVRIQNACTMMEQGFTSVMDIASKCGFSDAQYFSKVFKAKMHLTPREYINSIAKI